MNAIPPTPTFYGVDFSGATEAGKKIWIARAEYDGQHLHITSLNQARHLPNSGKNREMALAALRQYVIDQPPALWGFDFPFSLHQRLIAHASWDEFAACFAEDYPTPESLYDKGHAAARTLKAAKQSSRRAVDVRAKTPFPPHNLRLYRQTYHGIRDVLAPLAQHARVLPFHAYDAEHAALIEICPASTLKHLGLYFSYKGTAPELANARELLLHQFEGRGLTVMPELRDRVIEDTEGDALDAVIAAYCTFDAYQNGEIRGAAESLESPLIEGYVYGAGLQVTL